VLRKKPVIFLHWFHHVTVLLYCWHAYHHEVAAGMWFATMNFSVHSVMYLYYFLMNAGFYNLVRPIAPFITAIQILQMVGGMVVLLSVAWTLNEGKEECAMDKANYKLGLLMYFSYFVLFAILFYDKYLAPKPVRSAKPAPEAGCVDEAAQLDASGLFRPDEEGGKKLKKN
jgi:NADH:ubiquinone oxidoreductase subunit 6 (subunit J)